MKNLIFLFACLAILYLAAGKPAGELGKDVNPPKVKPLPAGELNVDETNKATPLKGAGEGEREEEEEVEEDEDEDTPDEDAGRPTSPTVFNEKFKGPQTEEEKEKELEAELSPEYFEGDLKLSKEEIEKIKGNTVSKKDAVTDAARKWPNARVPFVISRGLGRLRTEVLKKAIAEFNKRTCVRFVPKKRTDKDYIVFIIGRGCYSTAVGKNRRGGRQTISIGHRCNYMGTVIHEMMHAIGFFHEHTRLDRDQYITINWQNIEQGAESQFQKYNHGEADYLGEPYDYDSLMHYPRWGFGIKVNGKSSTTIVPKDKPWRPIGERQDFSEIDLRQINKLYKCTKFTSQYS